MVSARIDLALFIRPHESGVDPNGRRGIDVGRLPTRNRTGRIWGVRWCVYPPVAEGRAIGRATLAVAVRQLPMESTIEASSSAESVRRVHES